MAGFVWALLVRKQANSVDRIVVLVMLFVFKSLYFNRRYSENKPSLLVNNILGISKLLVVQKAFVCEGV